MSTGLRRAAFVVGVLALTGLCVRLGLWQWHRMETKDATAAAMKDRLADEPVPLRHGHPEWTRVRATGRFVDDRQLTVKFLVRDGAPGVDVVAPLVLADGHAVIVDRGWMPSGNDDARPTNLPPLPRGPVTIEGWWRPDSQADRDAVVPAGGQVRAIASRGLRDFAGRPLLRGYVNQQAPRVAGLSPEPEPRLTSALNFFYALQWWFFAALAGVGLPWMALRQPETKPSDVSPTPDVP